MHASSPYWWKCIRYQVDDPRTLRYGIIIPTDLIETEVGRSEFKPSVREVPAWEDALWGVWGDSIEEAIEKYERLMNFKTTREGGLISWNGLQPQWCPQIEILFEIEHL